jgi:hypothetical protein
VSDVFGRRLGGMAPTPWVEFDAVNIGENLTPSTVVGAIRRLRDQPVPGRTDGRHRAIGRL